LHQKNISQKKLFNQLEFIYIYIENVAVLRLVNL